MTLKTLILSASKKIDALDVQIIAQKIFGLSQVDVLLQEEKIFPTNLQKKFLEIIEKRFSGQSISEIFGEKNFFGRNFSVNNEVLTPRPETEILVEESLQWYAKHTNTIQTIIDIGTGSGCIGITLAAEIFAASEAASKKKIAGKDSLMLVGRDKSVPLQEKKIILTDISSKAIIIAKKNAKKFFLEKKIEFRQSNLLEKIFPEEIQNALIVTNLPYIPQGDKKSMSQEVLGGDPELALFSGEEGTDLYQKFFTDLPDTFAAVFFEYDPPQTEFFKKFLLKKFPKRTIEFFSDLNGDVRFGKIF